MVVPDRRTRTCRRRVHYFDYRGVLSGGSAGIARGAVGMMAGAERCLALPCYSIAFSGSEACREVWLEVRDGTGPSAGLCSCSALRASAMVPVSEGDMAASISFISLSMPLEVTGAPSAADSAASRMATARVVGVQRSRSTSLAGFLAALDLDMGICSATSIMGVRDMRPDAGV